MAITAQLVDRTPQALVYLLTQDGVISSPPVPADGLMTIPNVAGPTPDLRTDANAAEAQGADKAPILKIAETLLGVGASQATARALLESSFGAGPNFNVERCIMRIVPRTGNIRWTHDAIVNGTGFAEVQIRSEVGVAATAYLHILFRHTEDL